MGWGEVEWGKGVRWSEGKGEVGWGKGDEVGWGKG